MSSNNNDDETSKKLQEEQEAQQQNDDQQQQQEQQQHEQQRKEAGDDDEEAFADEDFEVVDDGNTTGQAVDDDEDNDDEEGADEAASGENEEGEPIVDKTPDRDDSFVQFFPPREESRKPLHAIAVHPIVPNIVVTAGEQDIAYVLRLPTKLTDIPEGMEPSKMSAAAAAAAAEENNNNDDTNNASTATNSSKPYSVPEKPTWDVFAILQAHKDTITKLAFSPNGNILASGAMDGKVILWNSDPAKKPSCLHHLNDLEGGEIDCLLWHPSSMMVVAGSTNAQIILWNAVKGTPAQYFSGHRDGITCLAWSNDVKKLISASADGSVMMYNPKTGAVDCTVQKGISEDNAGISAMLVMPSATPDAPPLVLAGCYDGSLSLVSLQQQKGKVLRNLAEVHEQAIESIAMTPPGSTAVPYIATCSCDCKLVLWSLSELTASATINCSEGMTKVLWMNSMVAAACTDGDIRCWDSRLVAGIMSGGTAEPHLRLQGHRRLVLDIDVAHVGVEGETDSSKKRTVIVAAADDGFAKAFSVNTN